MPSITVDGASIPAERGEAMREAMQRAVCRVVAIADLTHDIRRFRLAVESGGPFEFSAGQYARVEFEPGVHREYSMANPPHDSALEFHVRRTANGLASNHVFTRLATGDPVRVEGPLGTSYLRERHPGPSCSRPVAAGWRRCSRYWNPRCMRGCPSPFVCTSGSARRAISMARTSSSRWPPAIRTFATTWCSPPPTPRSRVSAWGCCMNRLPPTGRT
ncbi:MAG: hypothetical protein IPM02_12835 [Betaproteobacteria bacterium]|nr:hypothetical protein [Betaproteobacteria bacterium]